jgi:transketolase
MSDYKDLMLLAAKIRRDIVLMIGGEGQVGHLGGSCSCADIIAVLYGRVMRRDCDKFLLSKGHAALAQYAALAELGYFPYEDIFTVKRLGSHLQGHPDRIATAGIEAGTGSLGQGLSVALGMALAQRLDKTGGRTFCVTGDGELAEGQIWEAAMAAVNFKADNLVAVVDNNRLQATGAIRERFNTAPLSAKWAGFGWNVIEIDGHDIRQILDAFDEAASFNGKPTVIIASTVKGKGVSFAENVVGFHNGALTAGQYEQALSELNTLITELERGAGNDQA